MKQDIIVNDNYDFLKKEYLGCGFTGECYLTDNNMVFKKFFTKYGPLNEHRFFQSLNVPYITFPKQLVFNSEDKNEESYIGYLKDYKDGILLSKLSDDTNIGKLLTSIHKLENSLINLGNTCILAQDLNKTNLIYNNGELSCIDIDRFEICYYLDEHHVVKENIKDLAATIISLYANCEFKSERLCNLKTIAGSRGNFRPSSLINEILNEEEMISKERIDTVGDYKRMLSLVKE